MHNKLLGHHYGSQGETILSNGYPCKMPLLTYRARTFATFFSISATKARALLPSDDLRPVLVSPGRALITVQAMEYIEKSMDPYREFAISIPVHRSPSADFPFISLALWERLRGHGNYITHLAVDTEQAQLAGQEILGFPKFIANIDFAETPTEHIAEASVDGQPVFTLAVRKSKKEYRREYREFHCYSVSPIDNQLYHIPYQSEADGAIMFGSRSARLHLGSHPVADELRDLGIGTAPVLSLDVPQYTLVSNRPEAKIDLNAWRDPRNFYRELRIARREKEIS